MDSSYQHHLPINEKRTQYPDTTISLKLDHIKIPELPLQFADICSQVEISNEESLILTNLRKRVQEIAYRCNPRVQLATFLRHNYLKLRNSGSNQLLLYLSESQYRPLCMKYPEIQKLFQGSHLKPRPPKSLHEVEAGFPFMDTKSERLVGIVTHSDHHAEVLSCQLAKYLIKFDPRAKSLLTLVHYWARENNVTLSESKMIRKTTSNMPDPAALEWLCLFFLGKEKIIPTLKELRNQAKGKRNVIFEGNPLSSVSFPKDKEFFEEWRAAKIKNIPGQESNQYVLDILKLAHGFFSFCSSNDLKGKVLNTTDGEILPSICAIEEGLIDPSLSADNCKDKYSFEMMRQKALALEAELEKEFYLMQPFLNRRFEVSKKKFEKHVRPLMELVAKKVEVYLENMQKTEDDWIFEVDIKTLLDCQREEVCYGILKRKVRILKEEVPVVYKIGKKPGEKTPLLQLCDQFASIGEEVEISEKEYLVITTLLRKILRIAGASHPRIKFATIFRHNYLKLRNASSNQLLIYLSELNHRPLYMKQPEVDKIFEGSELKPSYHKSKATEAGVPYLDTKTGLQFALVTHPNHQPEVVSCQLLKYLQLFDPRLKSLLTLLHFWARENNVKLAETGKGISKTLNILDPAPLEWLCVFFLSQKNVIPTLQELRIQARGKNGVQIEGRPFEVSFPKDLKFVGTWRAANIKNLPSEKSNEYVLNVMRLAYSFFKFYSKTDFGGKVLNTKDGRLLSVSAAIDEEMVDLERFDDAKMKDIYLKQPFLNRRFEINQGKFKSYVQPLMEKTGRKLGVYLKKVKMEMEGGGDIPEADLRSLFQCGEVEKQINIPAPVECQSSEGFRSKAEVNADPHFDSVSSAFRNCLSLTEYFYAIVGETEVPEKEWKKLGDLAQKLTEFFASHEFLNCELTLFRNRYLKLQPMDKHTDNIFFVDHPGLYSTESGGAVQVLSSNWTSIQNEVFRIEENYEYSAETKCLLLASIEPPPRPAIGTRLETSLLYFDQQLFRLATRSFLPEVQTCKMVEYLCTFDSRVKPLMTVVFYWVKVNNIRFGKEDQSQFTVGIAPDPALLEWLVILFLCKKKIVPRPRKISGENADTWLIFDGVEIGVKVDPQLAQAWCNRYKEEDEDQHVLNVFILAKEFFNFWNEFGLKAAIEPMVIDFKNGIYFEKAEVSRNSESIRGLSWATGISISDLNLIDSEPNIKEGFYKGSEAVTILHPLHIKYGFSFCSSLLLKVCSKMGITYRRLDKFLEEYKSNKEDYCVTRLSFSNLLKVDN
ncbi:unnamed protein product [Orchesella dallaii]|uniref:Uncharacterized protein n=1 Tax=Orchesella dallaii TaxID=48710 RepID=A0ABP1RR02_9HEXA